MFSLYDSLQYLSFDIGLWFSNEDSGVRDIMIEHVCKEEATAVDGERLASVGASCSFPIWCICLLWRTRPATPRFSNTPSTHLVELIRAIVLPYIGR